MPLAPEPSADASNERDPETLIEVGAYASQPAGFDHGLVVLALGYPCWLVPAAGGARLLVEPEVAGRVREQLRWFDEENAHWPPPLPAPPAARRLEFVTPLLWVLAVLAVFRQQPDHPRWLEAGALDPAAVFGRGEWWRPFTALFFHADLGHLVANTLSGVFVFSAVLAGFGRARGWLLLALAAVLGNLAAAGLHAGDAYRSIGASTAVFGALGLLTGHAVRRVVRHEAGRRWRTGFAPLASGLMVLGLFGAGDVRVDVVAHATGFACGLMLGLAVRDRAAGV